MVTEKQMNKPKDTLQEITQSQASKGINDILGQVRHTTVETLVKRGRAFDGSGKVETPSNGEGFDLPNSNSADSFEIRRAFFAALSSRDFRKIKRAGDVYRKFLDVEQASVKRELANLGLLDNFDTPVKNPEDNALSAFLQIRQLGEGKEDNIQVPIEAPLMWQSISNIEEMHAYNSSVDEVRKIHPKINPYDFILRVYQPWVGVCLLREDITRLDKNLGDKYSKFLWRRNTKAKKSPVLPPLLPKRSQLHVADKRGVDLGSFNRRRIEGL